MKDMSTHEKIKQLQKDIETLESLGIKFGDNDYPKSKKNKESKVKLMEAYKGTIGFFIAIIAFIVITIIIYMNTDDAAGHGIVVGIFCAIPLSGICIFVYTIFCAIFFDEYRDHNDD